MRRIGVYGGAFAPFHKGHLAFCLEAQVQCGLDEVYIIPEREPRHKSVSSIARRINAVQKITEEYSNIRVIELPERQFTVKKTLPRLQSLAVDAELVMFIGSDVVRHMIQWPDISELLGQVTFAVGLRGRDTPDDIANIAKNLESTTESSFRYECIVTTRPFMASSHIKRLGGVAGRLAVDFSV